MTDPRAIVEAFDELERRRRREAVALRDWLVRFSTVQHGSISPPAPDMPHYGGMALLLDTEDVSDALGVSVPTVKRLIRGGALPAVKVAGATRVRRADLEAYVAGLDSVTAPPKASTPPTPATAGGTGNQGGEGHSLPVDPPAPPVGRGGRTVDRPPQAHPERTAS